jgi:hypothetical protein
MEKTKFQQQLAEILQQYEKEDISKRIRKGRKKNYKKNSNSRRK